MQRRELLRVRYHENIDRRMKGNTRGDKVFGAILIIQIVGKAKPTLKGGKQGGGSMYDDYEGGGGKHDDYDDFM